MACRRATTHEMCLHSTSAQSNPWRSRTPRIESTGVRQEHYGTFLVFISLFHFLSRDEEFRTAFQQEGDRPTGNNDRQNFAIPCKFMTLPTQSTTFRIYGVTTHQRLLTLSNNKYMAKASFSRFDNILARGHKPN